MRGDADDTVPQKPVLGTVVFGRKGRLSRIVHRNATDVGCRWLRIGISVGVTGEPVEAYFCHLIELLGKAQDELSEDVRIHDHSLGKGESDVPRIDYEEGELQDVLRQREVFRVLRLSGIS